MSEREANKLAKRVFLLQKEGAIDRKVVNELTQYNLFRGLNGLKLCIYLIY